MMIPVAVSFNDNERARRREIARVYGIRRKGPAQFALEGVALLQLGLVLLTGGGRRWSSPTLNRLQWAVVVAMLVTFIWFLHERRVRDRNLGPESGTPPDSPGDRGEISSLQGAA